MIFYSYLFIYTPFFLNYFTEKLVTEAIIYIYYDYYGLLHTSLCLA